MKRLTMMLATGVAAATLVTGCSSTIGNKGGDTTCKEFTAADEKTQNETITKMLTDQGKNEPSNLELSATRAAVSGYCQTLGTPDTKISQAPHL